MSWGVVLVSDSKILCTQLVSEARLRGAKRIRPGERNVAITKVRGTKPGHVEGTGVGFRGDLPELALVSDSREIAKKKQKNGNCS